MRRIGSKQKNFFRVNPCPFSWPGSFFPRKKRRPAPRDEEIPKEEKGRFPSPLLTRQRVRPANPNSLQGSPANALFSCRSLVLLFHAGMKKGTHFCECLRSWWKLQGSKPAPQARASPRFASLCRFEPCSVLSAQA